MKKYRIGNRPEEFELVTDYLDYYPLGYNSWEDWSNDMFLKLKPKMIQVVGGDTKVVTFHIESIIIKDAFHMEVYSEERFSKWSEFFVASIEDNEEKVIIPIPYKV